MLAEGWSREKDAQLPADRDLAIANISFPFLLDEVIIGVAGLRPLDALLVMAINQANIAPLTRDPEARRKYGHLEAPAPDNERRPVSINAVAASLGLSYETVRRHVRRLADGDVCTIGHEGVIVPASFLTSPDYLQSVIHAHDRLRGFYFELRGAGLIQPLPDAMFEPAAAVPIRAAARLLSDFLLRAFEGILREAGEVISGLVLLALLGGAMRAGDGSAIVGTTASSSALARLLYLPDETVRRRILLFLEKGLCSRTARGVALRRESFARPGVRLLFADNAANVQRLVAGLAERGVIRAWESG